MRCLEALYSKMLTGLNDENGATMIEYSLMVSFIAMVAFAAVKVFGINLNATFTTFPELFP